MRGGESAQHELVAPPLPDGFGYLVLWFNELHRRRQSGPNGPQPLVWSEIESWARQTGRTLSQWELRVLTTLDDAYFAATFGAAAEEETPVVARVDAAWPEKKAS
jgi:hypothetical protein